MLQQQIMLNMHHMHTLVCEIFKWNYELYTHTFIPMAYRFASINVPLTLVRADKRRTDGRRMTRYDNSSLEPSAPLIYH